MNKKELIDKLSSESGISKKDAKKFLDTMVEAVSKELSEGGNVRLVGFGTFVVKQNAARNGVDPRTKKKIKIPAKKVPKFIPGKGLREKVS